jgi:hypothetical protein
MWLVVGALLLIFYYPTQAESWCYCLFLNMFRGVYWFTNYLDLVHLHGHAHVAVNVCENFTKRETWSRKCRHNGTSSRLQNITGLCCLDRQASVLVRSSTCPVFPANRHQIMQAWIGYNLENYQLQLQGCITAVRVGRTLMGTG